MLFNDVLEILAALLAKKKVKKKLAEIRQIGRNLADDSNMSKYEEEKMQGKN
jgi:hypothetical protein